VRILLDRVADILFTMLSRRRGSPKGMPAAIPPTMVAATTQSTIMQNGGQHRVLATKWVRCCPRSLSRARARSTTSSHGDPVTAAVATTRNANVTSLSTAMPFGRPSATAKPT
jgi:hypothetical protein